MSLLVCGLSLAPLVVNLVCSPFCSRVDFTNESHKHTLQIRIHYGLIGEIIPVAGCIQEDPTPDYLAKRLVSRLLSIISFDIEVLTLKFALDVRRNKLSHEIRHKLTSTNA